MRRRFLFALVGKFKSEQTRAGLLRDAPRTSQGLRGGKWSSGHAGRQRRKWLDNPADAARAADNANKAASARGMPSIVNKKERSLGCVAVPDTPVGDAIANMFGNNVPAELRNPADEGLGAGPTSRHLARTGSLPVLRPKLYDAAFLAVNRITDRPPHFSNSFDRVRPIPCVCAFVVGPPRRICTDDKKVLACIEQAVTRPCR